MADPLSIAIELENTRRSLENLQRELSHMERADAGQDEKARDKHRRVVQDQESRIKDAMLRIQHLDDALDRACEHESQERLADLDKTEAMLEKERIDASTRIGQCLGEAMFLQQKYLGGADYGAWMNFRTPHGTRATPPEGCGKAFSKIGEVMRDVEQKLSDQDGNAASFQKRIGELADLKAMKRDPHLARHLQYKRRCVVLHDAKTGA